MWNGHTHTDTYIYKLSFFFLFFIILIFGCVLTGIDSFAFEAFFQYEDPPPPPFKSVRGFLRRLVLLLFGDCACVGAEAEVHLSHWPVSLDPAKVVGLAIGGGW